MSTVCKTKLVLLLPDLIHDTQGVYPIIPVRISPILTLVQVNPLTLALWSVNDYNSTMNFTLHQRSVAVVMANIRKENTFWFCKQLEHCRTGHGTKSDKERTQQISSIRKYRSMCRRFNTVTLKVTRHRTRTNVKNLSSSNLDIVLHYDNSPLVFRLDV